MQQEGFVDGADHEVEVYSQGVQPYNICGSLCTVGDVIVKNLELKDAKIGDMIAFYNIGVRYYDFNLCLQEVLETKDTDFIDKEGHMGGERSYGEISDFIQFFIQCTKSYVDREADNGDADFRI